MLIIGALNYQNSCTLKNPIIQSFIASITGIKLTEPDLDINFEKVASHSIEIDINTMNLHLLIESAFDLFNSNKN
jgi:hypothetical protein